MKYIWQETDILPGTKIDGENFIFMIGDFCNGITGYCLINMKTGSVIYRENTRKRIAEILTGLNWPPIKE